MKKLLLSLTLIAAITAGTFAQESKTIRIGDYENEDINTVFKRHKRDGFYFSWSNGYTPIDNKHGVYTSARMSWIMDHWFAFGLVGTGFIGNIDNLDNSFINGNTINNSLAGGYGGFVLEPILFPKKPIHISFPIILGAGAAGVIDDIYSSSGTYGDVFYVAEPGVELEMNFTRWLRIGLYGTYRYTSELNIDNIASDALRSYSAGVTFKIGLF